MIFTCRIFFALLIFQLKLIINRNNSAKITENENNTQSVYDVTASDYHCKVIKKENTVLYVTAYPEYKEDAEKLVKELGY